jgi:hypothetical protein
MTVTLPNKLLIKSIMNYDRKPLLRNLPGQEVTDKLSVLVVDGDVKGC